METTRLVIEEIFQHPPVSEAELKQRLSAADVYKARRVLIERLERTLVCEEEFSLFLEVFASIGIGEERLRLMGIAANKDVDTFTRTLAMTLLADDDPRYLDQEMNGMDPDEFSQLADRPLIELMTTIEVSPDAAEDLTEFLLETPNELREFLLARLGRCRREVGVSAITAYRHALGCEMLSPLHEAMVNAIVEEGAQESIELFNELRDSSTDPRNRRLFQGAIMRLSTRAIDPNYSVKAPTGTAYVGSCDGQGTFVILGSFKRPKGFSTTANLCIQAALDIRDGFVIPRHSSRELNGMLKQLRERTSCEFAVVPLERAASLVSLAEERTRALNLSLPEDSRSAVNLFRQIKHEKHEPLPTAETLRPGSLPKIRELLNKPIYCRWFFDIGDLKEAGLELPSQKMSFKQWMRTAIAKLDIPHIRDRIVAMVSHMQRWHSYRGENEFAAICSMAAQETMNDFQNSCLVRVMLEHTFDQALLFEETEVKIFGTPELRQYLKSRFFQRLKNPKGKHMAILDFTEVALSYLDAVITIVPGQRRPRDEEKPLISYTIGKSFWKILSDDNELSIDSHIQKTAQALCKVSRLKKRECFEVCTMIVLELNAFVQDVCSKCPVYCLERPGSRMSDHFFSPHHPVNLFTEERCDELMTEIGDWEDS